MVTFFSDNKSNKASSWASTSFASLRSGNLKKMHLQVKEELILPKPGDVKDLMNKMDKLLKLIESK